MHELPLHERVNNAEEVVPEISDPCNTPMNRGKVFFSGHKSNQTGDVSDSLTHNEIHLEMDKTHKLDETVDITSSGVKNGSVHSEALSPNHCKSPRLNVSNLPGVSIRTDSDSDADYELSAVSSRDLELDSDMGCTVQGSDEEGQESDNVLQLLRYHCETFYKAFTPYYEVASKSSKGITDETYSMIRDSIQTQKQKKRKTNHCKVLEAVQYCW
jgi:hypothetical protein